MKLQLIKTSLNQKLILTLVAVILASSCSPSKEFTQAKTNQGHDSLSSLVPSTPTEGTNPDLPSIPIPIPEKTMLPLSWEKTITNSYVWSQYIYTVIKAEEPQMLNADAALDTDLFCPRFKELTINQRLNFWGELFVGMAKYESGWDPTSRYIETTMPNDSLTGLPTASEGLLQLSYQDVANYGGVCEFDWLKDKSLPLKDPRRTILDPFKNLRCGIKIMARIIKRRGVIATETGAYWAVIKKNGSHHRINEISAMTKSLNFCLSAN